MTDNPRGFVFRDLPRDGGFGDTNPEQHVTTFKCDHCGATFDNMDALVLHINQGHIELRPRLFFQNVERHELPFQILETPSVDSWRFENFETIYLNGKLVQESELKEFFTRQFEGRFEVKLANKNIQNKFDLEFLVPLSSELKQVDGILQNTFPDDDWALSKSSIDNFRERAESLTTAQTYVSGICEYLRGVFERENRADPGAHQLELDPDRRYNKALERLKNYIGGSANRSELAEVFSAIIYLEFNLFDAASNLTLSPRYSALALRFQSILNGGSPAPSIPSPHPLEEKFLDSFTAEKLQLCCILIDGTSQEEILRIGHLLDDPKCTSRDKLKLHLVAYSYHLNNLNVESAAKHLKSLEQSTQFYEWAKQTRESIQSGDR